MGRKFSRTNKSNNLPKQKPTNVPKKPINIPQQNVGLLGTMAQGASMGAGMAVGSQIVHGLFSGNNNTNTDNNTNIENNIITEQPKCSFEVRQFQECLNNNKNDLGNCQVFYNYLEQCNAHLKRNA